MKLLTTAAIALALTGAAAVAHADDQHQNDKQQGAQRPAAAQRGSPDRGQPRGPGASQPGVSHNFAGQPHGQVQSGQSRFNGQAQVGQPHYNGRAPAGQSRFNGEAQVGQPHYSGQVPAGQQRFNGKAQVGQPRVTGEASGQRFNGQTGAAGAHMGFRSHTPRARDQGRTYYSASTFSRQYRAERRFRFGGYRSYPSGWAFRTWNYGQYLPSGWYGSQYYLDWSDYGLPAPPIGCEWIAEGPDAVLVDVWTGEVLSVYSGVFDWNG